MDKYSEEVKLALAVASKYISNEGSRKLFISKNSINWDTFKDLLVYHELHALVFPMTRDYIDSFPEALLNFLKINYYACVVRNQQLWEEYLRIFDAFKAARCSIVPIKGIAFLAEIYSSIPARPMTDIDVLVKEGELDMAKSIFLSLGYRQTYDENEEKYWRTKQCHISFSRSGPAKLGFLADVHFGLDFKRHGRNILPRLWDRVVEVDSNGRKIKLLSPEDTLFSLALHERRFGKTLCLKNVFDLALTLDKNKEAFDWEYVLREAKDGSMSGCVYYMLYQAVGYLGASIPEQVLQRLDISKVRKMMIRGFVNRNIFRLENTKERKYLYLKSHFLLYDNFWEPLEYIINIPLEQFSKFYSLRKNAASTNALYRFRLIYMPYKYILTRLRRGEDAGK
jgi:hypothetical protein